MRSHNPIKRHVALTLAFLLPLLIAVSAEARVFKTDHGRWTRRDPLGYVDGMNGYEVVGSNPSIRTDPSGTEWGFPDPITPIDICALELLERCENDPILTWALEYVRSECGRAGAKPCRVWKFTCEPKGNPGMTLCTQCLISVADDKCSTLAHELIHAGDFCRHGKCDPNKGDFTNCEASMCSEIRGAWYGCCQEHRDENDVLQCVRDEMWVHRQTTCGQSVDWNRLTECCAPGSCDELKTNPVPEFRPDCPIVTPFPWAGGPTAKSSLPGLRSRR